VLLPFYLRARGPLALLGYVQELSEQVSLVNLSHYHTCTSTQHHHLNHPAKVLLLEGKEVKRQKTQAAYCLYVGPHILAATTEDAMHNFQVHLIFRRP
jgi:hypothetical protein